VGEQENLVTFLGEHLLLGSFCADLAGRNASWKGAFIHLLKTFIEHFLFPSI